MSVTIREIAKELNMSPSTVSQALNNKGSLRTETRERVRLAARQMGYYAMNDPFGIDPTLSGRPIHLVIPGASNADELKRRTSSYFSKRSLEGIKSGLEPYKVSPVFVAEGEIHQGQPNNLVATIVLGGYLQDSTIEWLEKSKTPVVSVASPVPSYRICSVAPDAVSALRQAVNHLAELGHKRIAFLNGPITTPSNDHKLTGFVRAMYDNGMPCDFVFQIDHPFNSAERNRVITGLLESMFGKVTGIVCAHRQIANTVIKIATHMGFCIPDDLSVVAYDEAGRSGADEPVTTFGVSAEMLGRYAVSLALSVRANSELIGTSLIVRPHMIGAGSTAKVNSA